MLNICDLAVMIDCDNTGNMGSDAFVGNHTQGGDKKGVFKGVWRLAMQIS